MHGEIEFQSLMAEEKKECLFVSVLEWGTVQFIVRSQLDMVKKRKEKPPATM